MKVHTESSARRRTRRSTPAVPAPGGAAPGLFAEIAYPVLQAAARHVAAAWQHAAGSTGDAGEARDVLGTLARAVQHHCQGLPFAIDARAASPLGRYLLQELRTELTHVWSGSGARLEPAAFAAVLCAVEAVHAAIGPSWTAAPGAALAGPTGPDLLLEVAHDLRSPLTSILFLAGALQQGHGGAVNTLQRRQLGLIYSAALGLSSLVSDVIDVVRDADGLADQDPAPFSMTQLFESVREIVQPICEEKGLALRVSLPLMVHRIGPVLALSRVLLNLVTNALKFTDEGFVEIGARAIGTSRLELWVRDTGQGINPEVRHALFQPFRRAAGRQGYRFSGTGLGLAICRTLVRGMGSDLKLETRPGRGSRFSFAVDLPYASPL